MAESVKPEMRIAPESLTIQRAHPGRKLIDSLDLGWQSILVQKIESPATVDPWYRVATPDRIISTMTHGVEAEVARFVGNSWQKNVFRPGSMGVGGTEGFKLRWSAKDARSVELVYTYIPLQLLASVAEEYRLAGSKLTTSPASMIGACDPVIASVTRAMTDAVRSGASELYAESAAQFLAVHLLSMQDGFGEFMRDGRTAGTISDRRLIRVLDFMQHHLKAPLTLDDLAREAGISRYHFVGVFRKQVGVTPHRYLVQLRMLAAAQMLRTTDLSIVEIAGACGYCSTAQFTAAFKRHHEVTPSALRSTFHREIRERR